MIREAAANGLTPAEFIALCETYDANAHRFNGPGAIAAYIRNGDWPAEGIQPADRARAARANQEARQLAERREKAAQRIVYTGRRAGKTPEEIDAELLAAGLPAWHSPQGQPA